MSNLFSYFIVRPDQTLQANPIQINLLLCDIKLHCKKVNCYRNNGLTVMNETVNKREIIQRVNGNLAKKSRQLIFEYKFEFIKMNYEIKLLVMHFTFMIKLGFAITASAAGEVGIFPQLDFGHP